MDVYADLCCSFGLPVWIASLLNAAKRLRSDHARRKKVYRLLQKKLLKTFVSNLRLGSKTVMLHRVGVKDGTISHPTYVYPEEVKNLIRSVFPKDICDHPNPCHSNVVFVTVEDLHDIKSN